VTEKLYDALFAGTVPVYKGAPNVENFVPPHALIKVDDFQVPGGRSGGGDGGAPARSIIPQSIHPRVGGPDSSWILSPLLVK